MRVEEEERVKDEAKFQAWIIMVHSLKQRTQEFQVRVQRQDIL